MFDYNNDKAFDFFTTLILNNNNLNGKIAYLEVPNDESKKNILNSVFSKDALNYLICGSQGIPRFFCDIFQKSVTILKYNSESILSPKIICAGIIDHYLGTIRSSIPYAHPLYVIIEDYVSKTNHRFFLIKDHDYNEGIRFFDSLVARSALHQYPTTVIPRFIRNQYKVYFVHYGNYLESLNPDTLTAILEAEKSDESKLYPSFPDNLATNLQNYILDIPKKALRTYYCDHCHIYYEKIDTASACPECGLIPNNKK